MDELQVFVLVENYVEGIQLVKGYIYVGNIQVRLLKGPTCVGEVSLMHTYPGKLSTQKQAKVQSIEAKEWPVD